MVDPLLTTVSFVIGIVVGMTGMGGGALTTPALVLLFGVNPLAAVSSDLVASAFIKPVGSLIHHRNGTVNLPLVRWLVVGSVPGAVAGVLAVTTFGNNARVDHITKVALGIALLLAAIGLAVRAYIQLVDRARRREGIGTETPRNHIALRVRVLPTVAVGAVGGALVGLTSVGSGSLIIIALMFLYPGLATKNLVGTDLAQAVPLVIAAAVSHVFLGDVDLWITLTLIIGAVPGVWLGARMSSRAPGGFIKRILAFVLLASGLRMLGTDLRLTATVLAGTLLVAPLAWIAIRRRHGYTAFTHIHLTARQEEAHTR